MLLIPETMFLYQTGFKFDTMCMLLWVHNLCTLKPTLPFVRFSLSIKSWPSPPSFHLPSDTTHGNPDMSHSRCKIPRELGNPRTKWRFAWEKSSIKMVGFSIAKVDCRMKPHFVICSSAASLDELGISSVSMSIT